MSVFEKLQAGAGCPGLGLPAPKAAGRLTPKSRRSLLSRSPPEADIAHVANGMPLQRGEVPQYKPAVEQIVGIRFCPNLTISKLLHQFEKRSHCVRVAVSQG